MDSQTEAFDPASLAEAWASKLAESDDVVETTGRGRPKASKASSKGSGKSSSSSTTETDEGWNEPHPETVKLCAEATGALFETLETVGAKPASEEEVKSIARPGAMVYEKHAGRLSPEKLLALSLGVSVIIRLPDIVETARKRNAGKVGRDGDGTIREGGAASVHPPEGF